MPAAIVMEVAESVESAAIPFGRKSLGDLKLSEVDGDQHRQGQLPLQGSARSRLCGDKPHELRGAVGTAPRS